MVKVRVIGSGASAVGWVVLGSQQLACAVPPAEPAGAEAEGQSSAFTVVDPGQGNLDLQYVFSTGSGYAFMPTSGPDEFVRAGEQLTASLPAMVLWTKLHPNDPLPDVARLKQLSASVRILHQRGGQTYKTSTVTTTSFSNEDQPYALTLHTSAFAVGAKAQNLAFELTIKDSGAPSASAHFAAGDFLAIPVFGGELPAKHLVFDTLYTAMRQRVVEGGSPVIGADLVVTYTDWRANTLVDTYSLDREIGKMTGFGRFGTFEMPIFGELAFEVSYGVDFGDGAGFHAEAPLSATAASRVLPPFGRTGYETTLHVPANATKVSLYAHVKAYLVADYSRFTNITERRYAQGQRVLLRERWDNAGGVAGQNYDFSLEANRR